MPVIESHHNDIVGQISAKAIMKAMYDAKITEKREASAGAGHARITASDIMTPSPVTIMTKDRISTAKDIMIRRRIDHLPVVEVPVQFLFGHVVRHLYRYINQLHLALL